MTLSFSTASELAQLYDQDYYLWLVRTAEILQVGQLNELDRENLSEEIADMGKRERRAVVSNLEIVLRHLLKYRYQPEKRSSSWRYSIFEHRDRLATAFADSPSLRNYSREQFACCYAKARQKAALETDLLLDTFPEASPFTWELALDPDYLPDEEQK